MAESSTETSRDQLVARIRALEARVATLLAEAERLREQIGETAERGSPDAPLERPGPPAAAACAAATPRGSETVLLAEDERSVRTLARRILERAGYTVIEASSAAEAEARAATMPVMHLLLTDVMMPGGTGPELFRQLASTRPELRVLFMSGYAEHDLLDRAAVAGAPFLRKPFTVDGLLSRVREILDK